MKVPGIWKLGRLVESAITVSMSRDGQTFVPMRPQIAVGGLSHRVRCAYLAFTGKCDLVTWPSNQ